MVLVICSWFLVVFLGFFQRFRALDHQKTTVKTKKKHENSILRDSLKMVFFSGFFPGFYIFFFFFVVVGGFREFYTRFGG